MDVLHGPQSGREARALQRRFSTLLEAKLRSATTARNMWPMRDSRL